MRKTLTHLGLPADLPPLAPASEPLEQPDLQFNREDREHLTAALLDSHIVPAIHGPVHAAQPTRALP